MRLNGGDLLPEQNLILQFYQRLTGLTQMLRQRDIDARRRGKPFNGLTFSKFLVLF